MTDIAEQVTYLDYPEPVIASYLEHASALGPGRNPMAGLLDEPVIDFTDRLFRLLLRATQSAGGWWIVRGTIRHVSDKTARMAYRALFKKLRRDGWEWSAIQPIAIGLTSLRVRATSEASARRLYALTIGARIPAASIGWTW